MNPWLPGLEQPGADQLVREEFSRFMKAQEMPVECPDQLIDVLGHDRLEGREGAFLFFCEAKKSFAGFPVVHGHRFEFLPGQGHAYGLRNALRRERCVRFTARKGNHILKGTVARCTADRGDWKSSVPANAPNRIERH